MSKLADIDANKVKGKKLTANVNRPFIASFRHKLHKGFRLDNLEKKDIQTLQKFLDMASDLTVSQMDSMYKRPPDESDIFNGQQVQHYGFGDGFRVHGIYEEQRFEIIRIDPNHKFHK